MFLEHDDIYRGGGHQHVMLGPKLIDAPGECRTNHQVIAAIAEKVGAQHRGFEMNEKAVLDETIRASAMAIMTASRKRAGSMCSRLSRRRIFSRFCMAGRQIPLPGRWAGTPYGHAGLMGPHAQMPGFPDHWM